MKERTEDGRSGAMRFQIAGVAVAILIVFPPYLAPVYFHSTVSTL